MGEPCPDMKRERHRGLAPGKTVIHHAFNDGKKGNKGNFIAPELGANNQKKGRQDWL